MARLVSLGLGMAAFAAMTSGCYSSSESFSCTDRTYDGGARIESQADLEVLRGYARISSYLWIERNYSGSPDVRDLSDLICLEEIGGDLELDVLNELRTLDGLDNLREVGGQVYINGSPAPDMHGLENIEGLRSLTKVGGGLALSQHNHLTSLEPLRWLQEVGPRLLLSGLPSLKHMDFSALERADGLHFAGLGVETLDGVPCISELVSLTVSDNEALTNFRGLECITSLGFLRITGNASLTSFSGLESLEEMTAELDIRDNPLLSTCEIEAFVAQLRASGWTGEARIRDNNPEPCD